MFNENENENDITKNGDIQISDDGVVSWGNILDDSVQDVVEPNDVIDTDNAVEQMEVVDDEPVSEIPQNIETNDTESDISEDDLMKLLSEGDGAVSDENISIDEDNQSGVITSPDDLENIANDTQEDIDDISLRNPPQKTKKGSPLIILLALLLAILFVGGGYYFTQMFMKQSDEVDNIVDNQTGMQANQAQVPSDMQDVNNPDNNANPDANNGANNQVEVYNPSNESELQPEEPKIDPKYLVMDIKSGGRSNPFMPDRKYIQVSVPDTYINFENKSIPQPPKSYPEKSEKMEKMLNISVSGIMYDSVKPSAIITYDNNDYFVQKGDMLDVYKVIDITKTYVLVAYKKNTYKASVGEEFKINTFYGSAQYMPAGRKYGFVGDEESYKTKKHSVLEEIEIE